MRQPASVQKVGENSSAYCLPSIRRGYAGTPTTGKLINLPLDDTGKCRVAETYSVRRHGLILMCPGEYSPLRVASPKSSVAGCAFTSVSNFRSDPQSRPQSFDR